MLNRVLRFLRACTPEVRRVFFSTMLIALLFPIWTIVSAFGHVHILMVPLWVFLLIAVPVCHRYLFRRYSVFAPDGVLVFVTMGMIIVALTGTMDNITSTSTTAPAIVSVGPLRYIGPIVGVLCGETAMLVLGIFAFTGTFLGLGTIAPITPQLDFPDVKKNAQQALKGFAIAAFWLGLFGGMIGVGAPRLPWELTLGILLLAIIAVPGNLALPGDTAFKITFYVTIVLLIAAVFGAVWYLTNTIVPGILEPPVRYLVAALVITAFYGACLAVSFNLKQGWLYTTGEIISLLLVISVACLWIFYDGGKEELDGAFGVPKSGSVAQSLVWGVMYATLILDLFYGLSGVFTKKKIRLLLGLFFFCVALGGTHLVDKMFWQDKPLTGEYQELLKKSGLLK